MKKLDEMNKKVIPDSLTGGEQTIYWNDEGTFMMSIPHQSLTIPVNTNLEPREWVQIQGGIMISKFVIHK